MASGASSLLFALVIFQLFLAASTVIADKESTHAVGTGSFVGMEPILGVHEDDQMQSLGRFAVSENARRQDAVRTDAAGQGDSLTFVGVNKAYKIAKDVSATLYYLKMTIKDGNGMEQSYDAGVLVEPSCKNKAKTLITFGPSSSLPQI